MIFSLTCSWWTASLVSGLAPLASAEPSPAAASAAVSRGQRRQTVSSRQPSDGAQQTIRFVNIMQSAVGRNIGG